MSKNILSHAIKSLCIISAFFWGGCRKSAETKVEPVPVLRYDIAVMQLDTANLQQELQKLSDSFPLYLAGADWQNPRNLMRIKNFIEDPLVQLSYSKIQQQYAGSENLGWQLARIFDNTRKLFADFKDPQVYTYISYLDFVNRIVYIDSALSIALDVYIDGNEAQMDEIGIPRYMSRKLNAAHLNADVARVLGSSLIRQERQSLLDHIVYEGKVVCFMEKVLPKESMEHIFGYDRKQLLWCKAHEKEVWQYIVKQNLLFETNPLKFRHFVNEGPFNPLLEGAPARLSQYVGWRIVHAYLKKSGTDFNTLLTADPQTVLQVSAYRP